MVIEIIIKVQSESELWQHLCIVVLKNMLINFAIDPRYRNFYVKHLLKILHYYNN